MKGLVKLLLCSLLVTLWFELTLVPTARAHNCLENIQAYVANPSAPPKGMIEDCMRTGYAQALITAIIALIAAGLISREFGQTLIDKVQDETQKKDCRDRMKLVQDAAAEYRRYDDLVSKTAQEVSDIKNGYDMIDRLQRELDAAEQDYNTCAKWAAVLWGIGAPIGWVGKRAADWARALIPYLAVFAKARASYLLAGGATGFVSYAMKDSAALLSKFANISGFFFAFATALNLGYSEGEKARGNLEAAQKEILGARELLAKAFAELRGRENRLRSKSDAITITDQNARWHNIHSLWYKLIPDCTDEWSRLHGVLGGEQLSNLPSTRGLAPGWQQMALDQIQVTVQ